jgi:peroxiredoxin
MSDPLAIGTTAPLFEAPASDGATYRLSDILREENAHVALIFYPGNNTPG